MRELGLAVTITACLGASCGLSAQQAEPVADSLPSPRWPGADAEPLPFTSDEEVLHFLRTAEIIDVSRIPMGVTQPRVATLEKDGVRARAAFHDHHIVKDKQRLVGGKVVMHFRDSYSNQVAAYELGRLLGVSNVPPTVSREVDGEQGSLQLWIENARMESDRQSEALSFPDPIRAYRQVYDMDVFDALINNLDRSQRNFLWGKETWDLWLIDHTRAFGRDQQVREPRRVRKCSWRLWERLQSLDEQGVDAALGAHMGEFERRAVMARRKDLVRLLQSRIREQGESSVLFAYDDPTSVTITSD